MRDYEAIIAEFDRQREDAAQAIFRLAEALRKLGRIEEARVQYRASSANSSTSRNSPASASSNYPRMPRISFPQGPPFPRRRRALKSNHCSKKNSRLLEEQLARTKDLIKQGVASEASIFPGPARHPSHQTTTRPPRGGEPERSGLRRDEFECKPGAFGFRKPPSHAASRVPPRTSSNTRPVVAVVGSISQPGVVDFRPGMKICDAITERGGPDRRGDASRVRLTRGGESRDLDLSDIASQPENNVELEPGDSIIVPSCAPRKKPSTADATPSPPTDPPPPPLPRR